MRLRLIFFLGSSELISWDHDLAGQQQSLLRPMLDPITMLVLAYWNFGNQVPTFLWFKSGMVCLFVGNVLTLILFLY